MVTFALAVSLVIHVGCRSWIAVPTLDTVRAQNRERLSQLTVGMSKAEVLAVMGTESIQTYSRTALPSAPFSQTIPEANKARYRAERISNPYRTETSASAEGEFVELLFYYTDRQAADEGITNDELTPLVIENGKLAGWGWSFLDQNVEKYRIEIRNR
ncbi:DUF3192 domain-containing protein [Myxococcota bacterium]|nr:DUF3192 domain-containing protein [Myxococcota bacterium]